MESPSGGLRPPATFSQPSGLPGSACTLAFRLAIGKDTSATLPEGDAPRVKETLLNIAIALAILVGSYAIMHFFARAMYIRCPSCHTL